MKKTTHRHSRLIKKRDDQIQPTPATSSTGGSKRPTMRSLRARLAKEPGDLALRTELAERIIARKRPEEAVTLLESYVTNTPPDDDAATVNALRVLAFALVGAERFDDALRLAQAGLDTTPNALDLHYLIALCGHKIDSHGLSEAHANAYLQCLINEEGESSDPRLRSTSGRRYEVYNTLGVACEETGRINEALSAYESAIESRRSYDTAWANLARLLTRIGRIDDARAVLKQGRNACPRSQMLRRIVVKEKDTSNDETPNSPRVRISLCMIVKNEEEHLARCLRSAKELVDQIIVVDTGSADRTVEIAESFGAEVYHHAWEGDFSKARNISMGYADCDWILIMDADEELEIKDIPIIRHAVQEADFKVIAISVYNYSAQKELYTSFLPSNRLVRRDAGGYYEGIVHNQLRIPDDDGSLRIPARLYHYGYGLAPEVMERKVARSMALLEQQLEKNPDHGFAHFNIAQLLRGQVNDDIDAQMDKVIAHASRAVELCDPTDPKVQHIHVMALHQLVTAYINKNAFDEAERYAHRALEQKPGYLDVILSLGHIHSMAGHLEDARRYYLEYLDKQRVYNEHEEIDQVILLHLRSRHNAFYGLGLVAMMADNAREAADWFEKCLGESDQYLDTHYRLGVALYHLGETERAQREIERELALHPDNQEARTALTDLFRHQHKATELRQCLEVGVTMNDSDPESRLGLARIDLNEQRFESALEHLDASQTDREDRTTLLLMRAEALYGLARWSETARVFAEYLELVPDDQAVINDLGNCHYQLGEFAKAEQYYRRAIDTGRAEHCAYRNLAAALTRQQKLPDAVFAMESYLELEPTDTEAAVLLGDLCCASDEIGRAIDYYELAAEQDGRQVEVLIKLADCYLNRNAIDAALAGYEAALEVDPENEAVWERLRALREYLMGIQGHDSSDREEATLAIAEEIPTETQSN
jgi:tetratricopeptide (TPR) repeat protein